MKFKFLFFFLVFIGTINAQSDWRIAKNTSSLDRVERVELPKQDNNLLLEQELERRGPGIAPRFAVNVPVNITPETHGTWENTPSGKAVWRLRIYSEDAKSLNLGFTKYFMPEGGILVIYSTDKRTITGPFSKADNEEHEELWTPIFPEEELVIEVQVPLANRSQLQLELKSINHDFLGFGSLVSGSCNLDVICGTADGFDLVEEYRDIIQSVAVIGLNGGTFCTGFLVNNARQDCTPYFMTADHCGINAGNAASLVAYWNYQNSTCRQPDSPESGQNGDGVLNDFNTGSIFRAGRSASDFTLVELDDPINESANAFLAGWNRSVDPPTSAIGVHHPSTDEKRISFEDDPLSMTTYFSDTPTNNFTHVRVGDWDLGTTEPGSSGSPLFDQDKRVVGQLHGGTAACGNNAEDWYGAFARSWDAGGATSSRLREWLDPDGTDVSAIDGIEASFCSFSVETPQTNIQVCSNEDAVYLLSPSLNFTGEVQLEITGIPAGAMYTLSNNPVNPGDTSYLTITNINTVALDDYIINVSASDSVNMALEILVLSVINTPASANLISPTDGEINVNLSTTYQWAAVPSAVNYHIEIATDIDFNNVIKENMLSSTAYSTGGLENGTTYYWRVTSFNDCGETTSSVFSFSTPLDFSISTSPASISICNTETAAFSLSIGNDFTDTGAMLSASNLPAGATVTFDQNPALPGSSVVMSIENLNAAVEDDYVITITADDGVNSTSKNITLVLGAAPVPINMNEPDDEAIAIDLQPKFTWLPSTGTDNYTLEVATDSDFNNIVATTMTFSITVYTLPNELNDNTTYYWRVIATGECGTTISETRSFSTIIIDEVVELNNTTIDIRPNPTSGILNISLSGALPDDLTVEVYGINGQQLIRQVKKQEVSFEINLQNYPDGIYLLKLVNAQHVLTRKIILNK